MKAVLITLIFTIVFAQADEYTNRYDNYDVEVVIHNRRLLVPYVKCVLEQEKCTLEGRILKAHINDALQNGCARCTERQRDAARLVINHLILNEKDLWRQLTEKYDTKSSFVEQYEKDALANEEELKKKGNEKKEKEEGSEKEDKEKEEKKE